MRSLSPNKSFCRCDPARSDRLSGGSVLRLRPIVMARLGGARVIPSSLMQDCVALLRLFFVGATIPQHRRGANPCCQLQIVEVFAKLGVQRRH